MIILPESSQNLKRSVNTGLKVKYIHYCLELRCLRLLTTVTQSILPLEARVKIFANTMPPKDRQNFLLEVYWPPITFSTSIWLWWNAVLSPPTPKHDCTDDNTPPCSTHPPPPFRSHPLLTRYEKPVKRTNFYIICTHAPQWKQQCWVQSNKMQGGGGTIQMRWGCATFLSPRKGGGG